MQEKRNSCALVIELCISYSNHIESMKFIHCDHINNSVIRFRVYLVLGFVRPFFRKKCPTLMSSAITLRMSGRTGLEIDMIMYSDHLQQKLLHIGHTLLIFMKNILVLFYLQI